MAAKPLTVAEVMALPAVVDIVVAGRAFGLGRTTSYALARKGEFPCRVVRVGSAYRVPTAELRRELGLEAAPRPSAPSSQPQPIVAKVIHKRRTRN
ncbi:helix-turn-helix domain-containing protein [Lentzea alba]|uniref:helix-turn-helix domain-containing protein n=1 Tax=Lentzea alba TaxID=2714351 RepID=UPI001F5E370A|nr:helix-turn-helix domain-containing protein [Lentzea alba]